MLQMDKLDFGGRVTAVGELVLKTEGTVSVGPDPSPCVGFHKAEVLPWTKGLGLTCLTHWYAVLLADKSNCF